MQLNGRLLNFKEAPRDIEWFVVSRERRTKFSPNFLPKKRQQTQRRDTKQMESNFRVTFVHNRAKGYVEASFNYYVDRIFKLFQRPAFGSAVSAVILINLRNSWRYFTAWGGGWMCVYGGEREREREREDLFTLMCRCVSRSPSWLLFFRPPWKRSDRSFLPGLRRKRRRKKPWGKREGQGHAREPRKGESTTQPRPEWKIRKWNEPTPFLLVSPSATLRRLLAFIE